MFVEPVPDPPFDFYQIPLECMANTMISASAAAISGVYAGWLSKWNGHQSTSIVEYFRSGKLPASSQRARESRDSFKDDDYILCLETRASLLFLIC